MRSVSVYLFRVSAEHIIGSTTDLEILIIVENRGEDSFNTKLWIDLPPGVTYNTITNQRSNISISCDALKPNNTKVACDLGNPMQKGSKVSRKSRGLVQTSKKVSKNEI